MSSLRAAITYVNGPVRMLALHTLAATTVTARAAKVVMLAATHAAITRDMFVYDGANIARNGVITSSIRHY